jgi:hypothetical protein
MSDGPDSQFTRRVDPANGPRQQVFEQDELASHR